MDNTRGRSPSRGNAQHISPQPSPNHYPNTVQGVDPSIQQALTHGKFNTANVFNNPFLASQQQGVLQADPNQTTFYDNGQYHQNIYADNQFGGQNLGQSYNNGGFIYQSDNMNNDFNQAYSMNQVFDMNPQNNVNPAELSKVSSPQDHQSPGLQPPENQTQSSQPGSPASTNGQFYTPQHSRNASLDPSSAYSGLSFTQHRRAPSEHSEVSSAQHSPYLAHAELHNTGVDLSHSPYLPAQPDSSNTFGIESFNLGDQAYRSPRLMPHLEGSQPGTGMDGSGLLSQPMGIPVPDVYSTQSPPQYHVQAPVVPSNHMRNTSVVSDIGQADQFAPPTINIEPAPVSRQQSFGPQGDTMEGALSPPSSNRGRNRSKSDVTFTRPLSRSSSPGLTATNAARNSLSVRSSTPERGGSMSRESSPGPGVQSGRIDKNRRASTSSMGQNRDYILDLADPNRPNASQSGTSTRVQKHPATFQCTLCPKRFTRAYNLRSHLRTHTDERPFVCTVCGKAFARQHDRKRHEGLHSGEKKFVCKGELHSTPGQHWGCGRRFARADALGRHFRSEAGRICIKPLLEEEKAERQNRARMEQQQAQHAQYTQQGGLQPMPQPMMIGMDPSTGTGGFALPAALLQQYPALQNIDWSQISSVADDPGDLSDVGGMGRPSFDGSSGGEFYDEDISDGYVSGTGMDFANPQQVPGQQHMYMGS
ncbi:hypothetical protein G647_05990 [Cladophialophora carrionii CBS 160.54]|uniref:C2H2-type domain-containing protein n=1 Tax=Cladophialophora carrionii CBS 160.54 TaxID=1279043 RepID=V9D4Y4_9EURO|nr:uncharacterized protein G647_05990 [Cladophialophora carrionii CBS 160.54]ETI21920.1 hypothetical protein G647_05990 [Cladophialophora carrionii CBS 160.54]